MEEITLVGMDKSDVENWEKSFLKALFGIFGLLGFYCIDQNRHFPNGMVGQELKTFQWKFNGRNLASSYREINFPITNVSEISRKEQTRKKLNEYPCINKKLSVEPLMIELSLVFVEKFELQHQENSILIAFLINPSMLWSQNAMFQ